MLIEECSRSFSNGSVHLLRTWDGLPVEVTDTFLPRYTKDASRLGGNALRSNSVGSRLDRWMVGVSTMSGCPVGCKFCATAKLSKYRNLTPMEMVEQVHFVVNNNPDVDPRLSYEFKVNWTRMGEPFLNIDNVRRAMEEISKVYGPRVHHYVSTIGLKGSDFSWIKGNITLQFSVHSFIESRRDWLIPVSRKMTLEEMGKVRTESNLKTTLNMTLAEPEDFDIEKLKKWFDRDHFFVKLSPINVNEVSQSNDLTNGVISQRNLA